MTIVGRVSGSHLGQSANVAVAVAGLPVRANAAQDSFIVVASNGGADRPPGWLHNVKAQPGVEIQVGRRKSNATAEVLEPGHTDYDRLWKLVNAGNHQRYDA